MPAIEEVVGALTYVNADAATIREIVAILDQGATDIHGHPVDPVADPAFGPAPGGGELARHTGIAHRHVAEAMANMVAGLHGYRTNIESYFETLGRTDDDSAVRLSSLNASTECVATPDLAAPASCRLPGGTQDPGSVFGDGG